MGMLGTTNQSRRFFRWFYRVPNAKIEYLGTQFFDRLARFYRGAGCNVAIKKAAIAWVAFDPLIGIGQGFFLHTVST
jgi:hypothetical protein